ncbi:unnamed protein product [Caenorhabditis sp. 36 PRJEB53466]|nr:unnamed protein product [Caenorhabditis sp. 36 PRJEB53466]
MLEQHIKRQNFDFPPQIDTMKSSILIFLLFLTALAASTKSFTNCQTSADCPYRQFCGQLHVCMPIRQFFPSHCTQNSDCTEHRHYLMKLPTVFLLAALGFCAVYAADVVDGEVADDAQKAAQEEDDLTIGASPDAELAFHFVQPVDANVLHEFYAGKPVRFLIGFQNKGEKDFTVKYSETSFRFPTDYNYNLQNFTRGEYNRKVAPKEEVTLDYGFLTHESYAGRPVGLVVNVHYADADGNVFVNNVFNQTVNILEDDSGFSGETGFLFIFFVALAIGGLYIANQFLSKLSRKSGLSKRRVVEQGTSSEVDFEWIPRDAVKNKEKRSPAAGSPKARKNAKKAD